METQFQWFVGIDWGGEFHHVCVLDHNRRTVGERSVKHDGDGIGELIRSVVVIEVPHGPIVEALLACGISAFSINPRQVDRFRDGYTVNGMEIAGHNTPNCEPQDTATAVTLGVCDRLISILRAVLRSCIPYNADFHSQSIQRELERPASV